MQDDIICIKFLNIQGVAVNYVFDVCTCKTVKFFHCNDNRVRRMVTPGLGAGAENMAFGDIIQLYFFKKKEI